MGRILVASAVVAAFTSCGRSELVEWTSDGGAVPAENCSVAPRIMPFFAPGHFPDTFQSDARVVASRSITVELGCEASVVSITAVDPDFDGTLLIGFSRDGRQLASVGFDFDNAPGVRTDSRRSITASGIKMLELRPAAADFVAWKDLEAF